MKKLTFLIGALLLWGIPFLSAQKASSTENNDRSFRRLDILPAISYAPETKLTLGVIGFHYLDFYRGDPTTKRSNIEFLAVYTTAKQVAIETKWDLFTNGNRWRFRGKSFFNVYPDRNYGRGNEAAALVMEYEDEKPADTFNYLRFNSNRIFLAPVALRRLSPTLYLGIHGEMEYLYNDRPTPEHYAFINADSSCIQNLPVDGLYAGIGLQAIFDNRENVINPIRGSFLELSTLHFGPWAGSDYTFHRLRLDARHYINPWRNQTLALRGVAMFQMTNDAIPMRALSRVGGQNFIRGYFKGTYQDNHLLAFEAEYRLPCWPEGTTEPFWKIWKRLGVVTFLSGAQVFPDLESFAADRFHLAAGAGLRVLFNPASRLNIRIDYAVGLDPDSNGPGKRQTGFYFYLGEAF